MCVRRGGGGEKAGGLQPVAYIPLVMPALAFICTLCDGHFTNMTQVWLHGSQGVEDTDCERVFSVKRELVFN